MTSIFCLCIILNVSYLTKGGAIVINKNIIYEIKILDNMIRRKIITDINYPDLSIKTTPVQIKILHYLYINSNINIYQNNIEKIIECRRSTTSGILNTMEKNKLIKRINNPSDARSKQIILTDYGVDISKYMLKQKKSFEKKVLENISEDDLKLFFKVTEQIKDNIINID